MTELRPPMATYHQIQDWVRMKSGFVPKTCWIAHVKSDLGAIMRRSVNRYDHPTRVNPCPGHRRLAIEAALRHFEMIP
jgi:hypothetical protein